MRLPTNRRNRDLITQLYSSDSEKTANVPMRPSASLITGAQPNVLVLGPNGEVLDRAQRFLISSTCAQAMAVVCRHRALP
jgi:hypothetical protein